MRTCLGMITALFLLALTASNGRADDKLCTKRVAVPCVTQQLHSHHTKAVRHVSNTCFAYQVDGRGYPVKMPLELVVSFYRHGGSDNWHQLAADHCFYAVDGATGARLRLDHGCLICGGGEQQAIWPADVAVGTETDYLFTVYSADGKVPGFPSGYGTIYIPYSFAASSLWCFTASARRNGPAPSWYRGGGSWHYDSYYARVALEEVQVNLTARAKKFHRILKPDGVLGSK